MTVTAFSFVYALVVCWLFYLLRGKTRKILLTAASIGYAFCLNYAAGAAVLVVGVLTWSAGLMVESYSIRKKERLSRAVAYWYIALAVLCLLSLKYIPVYYSPLAEDSYFLKNIVMPAGFSFYIFQAISYIVDIKRDRISAEKNIFDLMLYLTYFPKFVSGPIERYDSFRRQLKECCKAWTHDGERWKKALYYMLFGAFLKVVVADRLGIYVDRLFEGYTQYSGMFLLAGALLYTMQIYCDFAGYSYLAMGVSYMFGIELMVNFDLPYCSSNITEFWRRWHISLSSWFLDYIYIPLGGNRKGSFRKVLNTMIVFLICGMWHGAGFSFIVWGFLHGAYSAFDLHARKKGWDVIRKGTLGRVITFIEVAFAWIFFRATSLSAALAYIGGIAGNGFLPKSFAGELETLQLRTVELIVMILLLVLITVFDNIAYKNRCHLPDLIIKLNQNRRFICIYLFVTAIFIFGIYGPSLESRLIYMGF